MLEKSVVPIQAAVVASLEQFPDLLVEKVRRLPHHEAMLEISAKWLGLDSSQDDVLKTLRREWSDGVLAAAHAKFHLSRIDESVELLFAGTYDDNRFLTGRVLVTF